MIYYNQNCILNHIDRLMLAVVLNFKIVLTGKIQEAFEIVINTSYLRRIKKYSFSQEKSLVVL